MQFHSPARRPILAWRWGAFSDSNLRIKIPTGSRLVCQLFLASLFVFLLAGCALPSAQTTPLPPEFFPTFIAQTVQANARLTETALAEPPAAATPSTPQVSPSRTPTRGPTSTLSALGPPPSATPTPTNTFTPAPALPTRTSTPFPTTGIPAAAVQIRLPGPLSKVISPLQVNASVRPGPDGRIRIELLGEDGRLLVRKILNYGVQTSLVGVRESLDFEISAAAETARLQISTYDSFNRLVSLASVELILLSIGEDDLNPSASLQEPVIIQEPLPNKLIQGGTLLVSGLTTLPPDQPLLIELVASNGKVVGYRLAAIQADAAETVSPEIYASFFTEVPYQVDAPTWARLTVKQNSSTRIPGLVYATSFEVLLSP